MMQDFKADCEILKAVDDEQQLVYVWASVVEKNGEPVVDRQGHIIPVDEITKAAHEFITASRSGNFMHTEKKVADVVESMVFTKALQAALGIDIGKVGWLTVFKVHDPETWDLVKKGKLAAASIGGKGVLEDDQND